MLEVHNFLALSEYLATQDLELVIHDILTYAVRQTLLGPTLYSGGSRKMSNYSIELVFNLSLRVEGGDMQGLDW